MQFVAAQNLLLDTPKIAEELDDESYARSDSVWSLQAKLDLMDSARPFNF
jgi:hypothetical protein